jgi:hypothetical protein
MPLLLPPPLHMIAPTTHRQYALSTLASSRVILLPIVVAWCRVLACLVVVHWCPQHGACAWRARFLRPWNVGSPPPLQVVESSADIATNPDGSAHTVS